MVRPLPVQLLPLLCRLWDAGLITNNPTVYSFLSHRTQPDDDFDVIVSALKEQAQYWTLASESPSLAVNLLSLVSLLATRCLVPS